MPMRLNRTLGDAYVSDDIWSAVREAESNTETIVKKSIDDFKKQLQEKAEALKNDQTVAQFDAEVSEIKKRMDEDLEDTLKQLSGVKTAIGEVKAALKASDDKNAKLKTATDGLNDKVKDLETALSDFETKLSGFGAKAGRFLVGQVTGRLLG